MYVCMYVCMYVPMYVCMYVHIYVCSLCTYVCNNVEPPQRVSFVVQPSSRPTFSVGPNAKRFIWCSEYTQAGDHVRLEVVNTRGRLLSLFVHKSPSATQTPYRPATRRGVYAMKGVHTNRHNSFGATCYGGCNSLFTGHCVPHGKGGNGWGESR